MKLNRRTFVGLMATSALPTLACPGSGRKENGLFGRRGVSERLNLCVAHIHIGLAHPFAMLQISDTHLTAAYPDEPAAIQEMYRTRKPLFGGQQEQALMDSLDWAKRNVDYVMHTGDLVDWYSRANFDLAKKYFGKGLTKMSALGNHEYEFISDYDAKDVQEQKKESFRPELKSSYPFDLELQSTVVNGINFVTMDDSFGTVTERQVARFRNEVKRGLPIVLAMHVPFATDKIRLASWHMVYRPDQRIGDVPEKLRPAPAMHCRMDDPVTMSFMRELQQEKLLKGILAGHLHYSTEDRFSETATQYVVGGNFLYHGREVIFT